jgi:NADPH:quinone reductase
MTPSTRPSAAQMNSGVYLTFFAAFISAFPVSRSRTFHCSSAAFGRFNAKSARAFKFDQIREAHRVMEANEAGGKMVIEIA